MVIVGSMDFMTMHKVDKTMNQMIRSFTMKRQIFQSYIMQIAKFREVIFQSQKTIFPFKTTTANLTYVTPTRSNMCTAAVWATKVDMSNMFRKITVGPLFTSCTLITAGKYQLSMY